MSKHAVDKKAIYKNGWFWLIIIIIGIILIVMINEIVENKEREKITVYNIWEDKILCRYPSQKTCLFVSTQYCYGR